MKDDGTATIRPQDVLDCCIGAGARHAAAAQSVLDRWFTVDTAFDASLRQRFGEVVENALAGHLGHWRENSHDTLAFIIVCDQMPRNIYRGSGRAFAGDHLASAAASAGMTRGWDRELTLLERIFFYLPFEHAEDLALQERYVSCAETLHAEAPRPWRGITAEVLKTAREHRDVIRRFGRFPHRNAALGRVSTAAERAWYAPHGRGWGQGAADLPS